MTRSRDESHLYESGTTHDERSSDFATTRFCKLASCYHTEETRLNDWLLSSIVLSQCTWLFDARI